MKKRKINIILNLIIIVCAIGVILLGIYLGFHVTGNDEKLNDILISMYNILPIKGYKNKVITEENYQEIMDNMKEELSEDEAYYASYSLMYYMFQDGISEVFISTQNQENYDEKAMYSRIYGKTINQLIKEGKELMQQENITIEQYKQNLNSLEE